MSPLTLEGLRARLAGGRGAGALDLLDLRGAALAGADLAGVDLRGALLMGADLTGADLTEADLTGANLTLANLTGARLADADLSFAHLEGAALHGCDLRGARLQRAYLSHAVLAGGCWEGATLRRPPRLSPEGAPRARRLCAPSGRHALALEWGAHLPAAARALPPVVALHGMLGRPTELEGVARLLGREVIALELLGHGARPCAPREQPPARFEELASDVGALAAAAADGRPLWLFGYSLGGRVALSAALSATLSAVPAAQPSGERAEPSAGGVGGEGLALRGLAPRGLALRGLCLLGAHPGLEPGEVAARLSADEAWAARLEGDEELLEVLRDWSAQPLLARHGARHPAHARALLAERAAQDRGALAWAMRAWSVGRMRPRWGDLGALRAPALWLHGAEDERYAALAARAAALCPRGRAAPVEGAGHAAHLEEPAQVAALLRSFMEEVEGGG